MFLLVTEEEVRLGLLAPNDVMSSALCFVRHIDDVSEHLHESKAWRFIDKSDNDVDGEARKMRRSCATPEFPGNSPNQAFSSTTEIIRICINLIFLELGFSMIVINFFRLSVSWGAEDVGVSASKHSKYLRQFCD